MAHLWVQTNTQQWSILPLDGSTAWTFTEDHDHLILRGHPASDCQTGAVLMSSQDTGKDQRWVLLVAAASGMRVNGEPVVLGIRTLGDKDEIRMPGGVQTFFSIETLARVERFPGLGEQRCFCPRCKQAIVHGSLAIRCPQCRVWHHHSEDLPCWSYGEHCAVCDQLSTLNADYRWTPEDL